MCRPHGFVICALLFLISVPAMWGQSYRHLDEEHTPRSYANLEEWLGRAEELRQRILISSGLWPLPARTPLNARFSDPLSRHGYTVQNVSLETHPGFYVVGNLYRPLGKPGPYPAILSPHGHWKNGRFEDGPLSSVPGRAINFARRGSIVFSYSMIGYNETEDLFPHRFDEPRQQLWGFGPLGLQLWNSLRALDFLVSLPEVDSDRIGLTGASGGGTQTFLLAAVDQRIRVAAPVNMISAHFQGGCICENAPLLRLDANNVEIGALMAPRPLMLISTSGDWTARTPTIEFPAIQAIYRLFDAEDRVANAHFQYEHNYNQDTREAVYGWFSRWLQEKEWSKEEPFQVEPETDLQVSLPSSPLPLAELFANFAVKAKGQVELHRPSGWSDLSRFRKTFGTALQHALQASVDPVDVKLRVLVPETRTQATPAILVVHPRDETSAALAQGLAESYRDQGWLAFLLNPYPEGDEFSPPEDVKYWTTYNPTVASRRIAQVRLALKEILRRNDVLDVDLVGVGEAGAWALLGGATGPEVRRTIVDLKGFSSDSDDPFLENLFVPLLRRAGDFRTAAAMLVPSGLTLCGSEDDSLKEWCEAVYKAVGATDMLRFEAGSAVQVAGALGQSLADNRKRKVP